MDTTAVIRAFILDNFFVADPTALADDTSLIDEGFVDSTGVLEITAFLERELGISIADEEIVPENLDSIAAIAAFVARKKRAA